MPRVPGTRRWLKMGVELEGAWADRNLTVAEVKGAEVRHDGSVLDLQGDKGEIVTRPHAILDNLCADVVKLYPPRINRTCGLHIHTSFNEMNGRIGLMDYSILADDEFYNYFRARWERWGQANDRAMGDQGKEFWDRWYGRAVGRGGRNFCQNKRAWLTQLSDANAEHRYTALNFSAWHKYQTVEVRLLPMMPTAELAVSAIREMSDIYDTFLNEHDYPVIKLYREFKELDGVLLEENEQPMPDTKPWAEAFEEAKLPVLDTSTPQGQWTGFTFGKKKGVRDYLWLRPDDDSELDEEAI